MAEENQTNENEQQVAFQLQRCYLKDASVEMPAAPELFAKAPEAQPEFELQFEVATAALENPIHEICVRATVTVKAGDKVLTIVECKQAGIFLIDGLDAEQLRNVTNVVCPSIIYPYLRANVADLLSRTTMNPVHLPEMDFASLYAQRQAQMAQQTPEANA